MLIKLLIVIVRLHVGQMSYTMACAASSVPSALKSVGSSASPQLSADLKFFCLFVSGIQLSSQQAFYREEIMLLKQVRLVLANTTWIYLLLFDYFISEKRQSNSVPTENHQIWKCGYWRFQLWYFTAEIKIG